MNEPKTANTPAVKQLQTHLQTLVELNHSASMGRRDAAFSCLIDYTQSEEWSDSMGVPARRQRAYELSLELLDEALKSTKRSAIQFDRRNMMDRPVIHVLKLLLELATAMKSLVVHIRMVELEAETLNALLGEEASHLLLATCDNFSDNEASTRSSFVKMLPVGEALLQSNTARHRGDFTKDDERRYNVAYNEYRSHYSERLNDKNYESESLPDGSISMG